jgi:Protein of unknown function (DUF4012)
MISQKRLVGLKTGVLSKQDRRPWWKKNRRALLIAALCLLVFSIVAGVIGYPALESRYRQDMAQVQTGARELKEGIALLRTLPSHPFDTEAVSKAQRDFADALTIFSRLSDDLNRVPDVLTLVPVAGARLSAAKHLLPLALDAAQAGLAGCVVIGTLAGRLHGPLNKNAGLTMADMTTLGRNLQVIKMALNEAIGQLSQVQPGDLQLDAGLGKMFGEFRTSLPDIQQGIDQVTSLFSVMPELLGIGTPANYLIEILDSTELRPGGGFIGNYGIVTLTGGQVTSVRVTDTYLLDYTYDRTHYIHRPYGWFTLAYKSGWGLRDSNLDADFPTSARNGEMLYNLEGGTLPLSGVIAITPALIEQILTLTGPVAVPEYHEEVTAQNLIDRIHYYQSIEGSSGDNVPSADGNSSVRKHFTALLGQYVLARVRNLPVSLLPKLAGILVNSLHTKDVQMYFNAAPAEKVLQFYAVDDAVAKLPGDGIFAVDANLAQDKANRFLLTTVNDQVTINPKGTAFHRTVIDFTWTKAGLTDQGFHGTTHYKAYVRVYVPAGGVLYTRSGWNGPYDRGITTGRAYWGGYFLLNYPLTGSITLTWSDAGTVLKDGHGWHYVYSMQRQAGAQEAMNVQVTLPSCASISHVSPGVTVDGRQQAHLTQVLSRDTEVNIDYTCMA